MLNSRYVCQPNQTLVMNTVIASMRHEVIDSMTYTIIASLLHTVIAPMTHMGIDNVTLIGIYFMMHAVIMCVRNGLQPMTRWAEVLRRIQAKIL